MREKQRLEGEGETVMRGKQRWEGEGETVEGEEGKG